MLPLLCWPSYHTEGGTEGRPVNSAIENFCHMFGKIVLVSALFFFPKKKKIIDTAVFEISAPGPVFIYLLPIQQLNFNIKGK